MTVTMYDSVADVIPADPQAVLGYRDGNWPNYDTLCSRFPRAEHLGLTVNGSTADADGCDVENGDLAPASGAAWTLRRRQLTPGFPPVVYCQVSSVAAVLVALAAVGVARDDVRLLTAHYGRGEHICSPACWPGLPTTADGTQWLEGGPGLPQAYDQSALVDTFFAAAAAKPPLAPPEEPAVINIIAHDRLHLFNVTPSGQLVWRAHASGAGFQTSVLAERCVPSSQPTAVLFGDIPDSDGQYLQVFAEQTDGAVFHAWTGPGTGWQTQTVPAA